MYLVFKYRLKLTMSYSWLNYNVYKFVNNNQISIYSILVKRSTLKFKYFESGRSSNFIDQQFCLLMIV